MRNRDAKFVTVFDAAAYLGTSPEFVRDRVRDGTLRRKPSKGEFRLLLSDIDALWAKLPKNKKKK